MSTVTSERNQRGAWVPVDGLLVIGVLVLIILLLGTALLRTQPSSMAALKEEATVTARVDATASAEAIAVSKAVVTPMCYSGTTRVVCITPAPVPGRP